MILWPSSKGLFAQESVYPLASRCLRLPERIAKGPKRALNQKKCNELCQWVACEKVPRSVGDRGIEW